MEPEEGDDRLARQPGGAPPAVRARPALGGAGAGSRSPPYVLVEPARRPAHDPGRAEGERRQPPAARLAQAPGGAGGAAPRRGEWRRGRRLARASDAPVLPAL